jgi:hypothetical protein
MATPRAFFNRYKPPGRDSRKAIAAAVLFLTRARSLGALPIEQFAHQQQLKPTTAARLIAEEARRRAGRG